MEGNHVEATTVEALLADMLPFWDELPPEARQEIAAAAVYSAFDRDAIIFGVHENDNLGIKLIVKGSVRVYLMTDEGDELTLYRLRERRVCMMSVLITARLNGPPVNVEARAGSLILTVPAPLYRRLIAEHSCVYRFSVEATSEVFRRVVEKTTSVAFVPLKRRLAAALLERAHVGRSSAQEHAVRLKVTHDELAHDIGSAREAVSRMLKQLVREGLVTLSRGSVTIVNVRDLELAAGEARDYRPPMHKEA
ncbi:Crp/Fnr family transcriptional regulator [Bacillota bacterium Meth-B3]